MRPTSKMPLAAALLLLLLLSTCTFADFSLRSLSVFINVNRDGSVNTEEQISIAMDSASSRELYEATRAVYSDLATWKNRTQLPEMRHHISRASADITNLRVLPQPVERCNTMLGTCYATVTLDYTVPAGQNGSGLIRTDRYKPRTVKYYLVQDALSFEQTRNGDLVLPAGTNITISIPQAAEKIYFSAPPQNLLGEPENFRYDQSENVRYYVGSKRMFNWGGDTLSKFQFTYEIESTLESEVLDFFNEAQSKVIGVFLGPEGIVAFIIIAAAAASLYYFNRISP